MFNFEEGEVILIDKPIDWTSFDTVNFIRSLLNRCYGIRKLKVGHAGTLDPLATGLLILCTGKMTKQIDNYQAQVKTYTGTILLGQTTPTFDLESEPNAFFPPTASRQSRLKPHDCSLSVTSSNIRPSIPPSKSKGNAPSIMPAPTRKSS
jgi:Pseudouridine synthase